MIIPNIWKKEQCSKPPARPICFFFGLSFHPQLSPRPAPFNAHPMRFSEVSRRRISRAGNVDRQGSHHQLCAGPAGAWDEDGTGWMGWTPEGKNHRENVFFWERDMEKSMIEIWCFYNGKMRQSWEKHGKTTGQWENGKPKKTKGKSIGKWRCYLLVNDYSLLWKSPPCWIRKLNYF